MTNTCPMFEWFRLLPSTQQENVFTGADNNDGLVPRPDNQSTCEGEICLNIGRSRAGVSGESGSVRTPPLPCQSQHLGFYMIQHNTDWTLGSCIKLSEVTANSLTSPAEELSNFRFTQPTPVSLGCQSVRMSECPQFDPF